VAGEVTAQLVVGRFPAAERLSGAGQAGGQTKRVQQPSRIVSEQMPAIDVHRIECRSRPQPDLRQLERLRDDPPLLADHDPWPIRQRPRAEQRCVNECPPIEGLSHV
jgi:hypothetical protein